MFGSLFVFVFLAAVIGIGEDSYLLLVDYLFVDATDESLFVGNHFGLGFDREIDGTQISGEKDHEKVAGSFFLHGLTLIL